jgi:hypothetical protein
MSRLEKQILRMLRAIDFLFEKYPDLAVALCDWAGINSTPRLQIPVHTGEPRRLCAPC